MSGDITVWTDRVTSAHSDKPKFMATLAAVLQPLADMRDLVMSLPAAFDLDTAVGAQLDIVGQWVGVTRSLAIPITGVYFAFDTVGVGWDEGSWWAPGDDTTYLYALPDDGYRTLLRAKIVANTWDGTIPGAYRTWDTLFAGTGYSIKITDLGGMQMNYELTGPPADVVTATLFTSGNLDIKPAGVQIAAYTTP
jgi:hypothetical protein